jgi:hypothetical protein
MSCPSLPSHYTTAGQAIFGSWPSSLQSLPAPRYSILFLVHRQLLSVLVVPGDDLLHLLLGEGGKRRVVAEGGDDGLRGRETRGGEGG